LGIDISNKLIKLAKEKNPLGKFEIHDIEDYLLPNNLDIIFAFASLIHVPKDSLERIFERAHTSLNPNGVMHISMKSSGVYQETTKTDEFGTRTYYLYSAHDIESINGKMFDVLKLEEAVRNDQSWLEVTLQKQS